MTATKTLFAGSVLTCALAMSADAQYQIGNDALAPHHASFTYDAASSTLTRTDPLPHLPTPPRGTPQNVADSVCFENEFDPAIFWGITAAGEELVDWGEKGCGATGTLSKIQFAYVTDALDPSMSGPGATMDLALYSGTAGTVPTVGTEMLRVPFTGLPGTDGSGPFFWIIDVTYIGIGEIAPVLPDGKIGWGYTNVDGVTYPMLVPMTAGAFGPDVVGYEADIIPDDFDDISGTGTSLGLSFEDDESASVAVGFDFEFYGAPVTTFLASTNGYLTDGGLGFNFFFDCIPSPINEDRTIAPALSDYATIGSGDVYTETKGTAPCRELIVQWDDIEFLGDTTSSVTMQVKLFEADDSIEFHYASMVDGDFSTADGTFSAVGIQGAFGLGEGLEIGCGTPGSTVAGQSYRITTRRENSNRTTDLINLYAAPAMDASLIASFAFEFGPGMPAYLASTHLILTEEDGTCGVASNAAFSVPANPTVFTSATPPLLGTTWIGDVDVSGFTNPTATFFALASTFGPCGGAGACPTIFGDLLINPLTIIIDDLAAPVAGLSQHLIPIPNLLSVCGQTFFSQVGVADDDGVGPLWILTNAIDVTFGF